MHEQPGLTIVTALLDLASYEDNPHRKSARHYLTHCRSVLALSKYYPIVIFVEPALFDVVADIADDYDRIDLRPMAIDRCLEYASLSRIEECRRLHPFVRSNEAKDTPLYSVFQRLKLQMLRTVAKERSRSHVAWLDVGIVGSDVPIDDARACLDAALEAKLDRVQLIAHETPNLVADWTTIRQRISAGFIVGPCQYVDTFTLQAASVFNALLEEGYAPHDEDVIEHIAASLPQLFTLKRVRYHSQMFDLPSKRARLCLNMIVKDEITIIERCLASVAPWIDHYVITDTGSTDGTPEFIESYLAARKVPGRIYHCPFVDFSQARNHSLRAAQDSLTEFDYILLTDADMQLVVEDPEFRSKLTLPSYFIQQRSSLTYDNTRLLRKDLVAEYVGATHEYLSTPFPPVGRIPGVYFLDYGDGSSHKEKFERDERLLTASLEANPRNARAMFYLGQTLKDLGRFGEAIHWYRKRIEAGGWEEEVWCAQYMIAHCLKASISADEDGAFVREALRAFNLRPQRAEPIYMLARYFREKGQHALANAMIAIGRIIPFPAHETLFIENGAYGDAFREESSISGFYSPDAAVREQGRRDCYDLATDRRAAECTRGLARSNAVHYTSPLHDLLGVQDRTFPLRPANLSPGYSPMNPSVCADPNGAVHAIVRSVNYRIVDGRYVIKDEDGRVRTENHLTTLREGDGGWWIERSLPIRTRATSLYIDGHTGAEIDRCRDRILGFEDCRLFRHDGGWWATATCLEFDPNPAFANGRPEMWLLRLEPSATDPIVYIAEARALRGYADDICQKNWLPFVRGAVDIGARNMSLLYSTDPTIVLTSEDLLGWREASCRQIEIGAYDHLRGSSQLLPFGACWLYVAHEAVPSGSSRRYVHRFVRLQPDFTVDSVSPPFYFRHQGIEFCAGIARVGGDLMLSYGVQDAEAYVTLVPAGAVLRLLNEG